MSAINMGGLSELPRQETLWLDNELCLGQATKHNPLPTTLPFRRKREWATQGSGYEHSPPVGEFSFGRSASRHARFRIRSTDDQKREPAEMQSENHFRKQGNSGDESEQQGGDR